MQSLARQTKTTMTQPKLRLHNQSSPQCKQNESGAEGVPGHVRIMEWIDFCSSSYECFVKEMLRLTDAMVDLRFMFLVRDLLLMRQRLAFSLQ
jgi:hypothetical protein